MASTPAAGRELAEPRHPWRAEREFVMGGAAFKKCEAAFGFAAYLCEPSEADVADHELSCGRER